MEQIPSALSAWAHSPLARLKSQRPARELTEFHMEARNRRTSCLSLAACPTPALICCRLVHWALSSFSWCVCVCCSVLSSVSVSYFFSYSFLTYCAAVNFTAGIDIWVSNNQWTKRKLRPLQSKSLTWFNFSNVRICRFSDSSKWIESFRALDCWLRLASFISYYLSIMPYYETCRLETRTCSPRQPMNTWHGIWSHNIQVSSFNLLNPRTK